ncbi:hypothetical protein [Methylobacterium sp. JK268]
MTLILRPAPPKGRATVTRALRDLWTRDPGGDAVGGTPINLAEPIPVYRLGLDQIDDVGCLKQAAPVGWRYLLEAGRAHVAVADVGERDGETRFASLSRGDEAQRLMEAAELAASLAEASPEDYEIRILDVPALHASAVWLSGARDVFIPYLDVKRRRGATIEVADDFLATLVARAEVMRDTLARLAPGPSLQMGG